MGFCKAFIGLILASLCGPLMKEHLDMFLQDFIPFLLNAV